MQHRDGHVEVGEVWRRNGCAVSGCTSRGAWATKIVNTQVRVLLCADRSDTWGRSALCKKASGQAAVGRFVHAEGCRRRDARPARLSRRCGEVRRDLCVTAAATAGSGSQTVAWRGIAGGGGQQCGLAQAGISWSALRKLRQAVRGQHRTSAGEVEQLTATGARHSRRATRLWANQREGRGEPQDVKRRV
jgi:hypothetical protein